MDKMDNKRSQPILLSLSSFSRWYPHPELNRDQRFRKPPLYPFELWGQWPYIHRVTHRSGQVSYQLEGKVEGKRKRLNFQNQSWGWNLKVEQASVNRANEGIEAFTLQTDLRLDAAKANRILAPHGATIFEAAKYYEKHVLASAK
jgi:hypothetical protein